jgi:hypothetical protein
MEGDVERDRRIDRENIDLHGLLSKPGQWEYMLLHRQ